MQPTLRLIRPKELAELLSVSTVTIWRMEKQGNLPPRIRITDRTTGWLESDLRDWLESHATQNSYSEDT